MREYAQGLAAALDRSGSGFTSYLRAGAALFASVEEVSPEHLRQLRARAEARTPSFQAPKGLAGSRCSKRAMCPPSLRAPARSLSRPIPISSPCPASGAGRVAPVAMFAPATAVNRRTLGYDMYADPDRAAAMAEAELTLRPAASGRIVLVQETSGTAPAFAIYMPVFRMGAAGTTERRLAGFVYTPFRAREFLDAAIDRAGQGGFGVRLCMMARLAPGTCWSRIRSAMPQATRWNRKSPSPIAS
ncbi:MAG: CHASE domain-containing protein [Mycobacterium sp.]|nr:CHASE domain-containing protein [Mycobacterium sp.]